MSGQEVSSAANGKESLAPGTVMALVAMGLGVLVIANDFTALNVAIPSIEQDFDINVDTSQWVINAYALVFGMAIVTGGRLADMFGRRRVFFIGTGLFAGFSALGAVAPSVGWLIGCRVGMGIGGAMMWPAILGHDLRRAARFEGEPRRRPDPRHRRARQRRRTADRRRAQPS